MTIGGEGWGSDLRMTARTLLKARGFAIVAILTLGVGLALCIAALTVVNVYLIHGLPYPGADHLYSVQYGAPDDDPPAGLAAIDWSGLDAVIEHSIAWDLDMFYVLGTAYPESAPGAWVTSGFVDALSVRVVRGRGLEAADFEAGSPLVALISHRVWRTRFAGTEDIVGQHFRAYVSDRPDEAETFTIVGVLPDDFWHVNPYTDVLAPLKAPSYPYIVKVRPGVPADAAAGRMTALATANIGALPDGWRVTLVPAQARYVAAVRPILLAVAAASALVLLIAYANVAVLMLVRGAARQKEIAVRLALGASRARIARLLSLEALLLGIAATATGLVLGQLVLRWLAPSIERHLERRVPGGPDAFALDPTVLAAAIAIGLVVTVAVALVPLLPAWRLRLSRALAAAGHGATDATGLRRTRSFLIALEVATSLTLLMGSALMVQTALRILRVDFGVDASHVLSVGTAMRQRSYPDAASRVEFADRLLSRVTALSGTEPVALGDAWPFQEARPQTIEVNVASGVQALDAAVSRVSAEYFNAFDVPVRDGRTFTSHDRLGSEPVVVISASLAERIWPDARAVGQYLRVPARDDGTDAPARFAPHLVVGVVGDVRQTHSDERLFDVYVPLLQDPGRFTMVFLRAPSAPADLERRLRVAVAEVDPEVAVQPPRSLAAALDEQRARPRFLAMLLTAFAAFAGLLALVGIYGVIAYAARQRQREIAVRMAIGADRSTVVRLFLQQGAVVLFGGLAFGLLGAVGAGRVLATQLFGVQPADARTLALTTITFAACGLLAVWWPARRAAATDPAIVLKEE